MLRLTKHYTQAFTLNQLKKIWAQETSDIRGQADGHTQKDQKEKEKAMRLAVQRTHNQCKLVHFFC